MLASQHGLKSTRGMFPFQSIPVVISGQAFDASITSTATKVLRDEFYVPINSDDVLAGQMENGEMVFYLADLDVYGDRLKALIASVNRVTQTDRYRDCHFVAFSRNATAVDWNLRISIVQKT